MSGTRSGSRAYDGYALRPMFVLASGILGLGESPSSFGQTLALLITFIGVGIVANVLIVYAVAQVLAERRENQERQQAYLSEQHHRR